MIIARTPKNRNTIERSLFFRDRTTEMSHKRKEPDSTFEREGVSIGNDCWKTVFQYLDQAKDRLSVLLTCKLWKEMGTRFLDPSVNHNYAIRWASGKGQDKVVKLLLEDKRVDPAACDNDAIRDASQNGHHKAVKLLLEDERVDPAAWDNYAIRLASEKGYDKVVKLLLEDKRVDPASNNHRAIRWAVQNGHDKVVNLLKKRTKNSDYSLLVK